MRFERKATVVENPPELGNLPPRATTWHALSDEGRISTVAKRVPFETVQIMVNVSWPGRQP